MNSLPNLLFVSCAPTIYVYSTSSRVHERTFATICFLYIWCTAVTAWSMCELHNLSRIGKEWLSLSYWNDINEMCFGARMKEKRQQHQRNTIGTREAIFLFSFFTFYIFVFRSKKRNSLCVSCCVVPFSLCSYISKWHNLCPFIHSFMRCLCFCTAFLCISFNVFSFM